MEASPRWALPLLFAGQAQKEIFHNEALILIDAMLHGQVESADIGEVPGDPAIGQCWIVAEAAGGVWTGKEGYIACWSEGGWRFIAPREGTRMQVSDRNHAMIHDGSQWRDEAMRPEGVYVEGQKVVGARQSAISSPAGGTVIDDEARMAVAAILATLRQHGIIDM